MFEGKENKIVIYQTGIGFKVVYNNPDRDGKKSVVDFWVAQPDNCALGGKTPYAILRNHRDQFRDGAGRVCDILNMHVSDDARRTAMMRAYHIARQYAEENLEDFAGPIDDRTKIRDSVFV